MPSWTAPATYTVGSILPASSLNTYLRDDSSFLYNLMHFVQQGDGTLGFWQAADGVNQMLQLWNSAKSNWASVGEGSDNRAYFANGASPGPTALIIDTNGHVKLEGGGAAGSGAVFPQDVANLTLGGTTSTFTTGLDLADFTVVSGASYIAAGFAVISNQNGGGTSSGSVHFLSGSGGAGSDLMGIPPGFTTPSGSSQNCGVIIPPFLFTAISSVASFRVNVSAGTVQVLQQGTTAGTSAALFMATQAFCERVG